MRQFVPIAALAYAIAVVLVIADTATGTSYAAESGIAAAADLAAGFALLAAGAAAVWSRARTHAGTLAVFAGAAWFAPDWEGWATGPPVVRSLGMLAAPLVVPLLFHLVLAFPARRLRGPRRLLVRAIYSGAAVVSLARALVGDPFLDPECWRNCTDNTFLLLGDASVMRTLDSLMAGATVVAGALLTAAAVARLASVSLTARRVLLPVELPGACIGASVAAYGALLVFGPPEDPADARFMGVFLGRSITALALALGLGWSVVRARRVRSTVVGLATELGEAPPPGSLRAVLAEALGDPSLLVAYWLPRSRHYVDSQGRPIELPPDGAGRSRTPIVRDGREVAVVAHDTTALEPVELLRAIGAAARLAVENERLAAETMVQVRELTESRARIVERGDRERRRLERDLHDGAQQRLLTLSYRLRVARSAAESSGRADLVAALECATDQALDVLAGLRELAHGIHPAVLREAGLAAALATLGGGAALPVEIREVDDRRYSSGVETAAYLTVHEAVQAAARRGASHAAVRIVRTGRRLVVEVADDAATPPPGSLAVADRVGALGGRLEAQGSLIRAEIPCA